MVRDDRNLRPIGPQPWWALVAALLLTLRGETPPAAGELAPADRSPLRTVATGSSPSKVPARRVRPEGEYRVAARIDVAGFHSSDASPSPAKDGTKGPGPKTPADDDQSSILLSVEPLPPDAAQAAGTLPGSAAGEGPVVAAPPQVEGEPGPAPKPSTAPEPNTTPKPSKAIEPISALAPSTPPEPSSAPEPSIVPEPSTAAETSTAPETSTVPEARTAPRLITAQQPIAVPEPSTPHRPVAAPRPAEAVRHRPWAIEDRPSPKAKTSEVKTAKAKAVVSTDQSAAATGAKATPSPSPPMHPKFIPGLRERLEGGVQAAERRACYTARAEFLAALRQIAENADGNGDPEGPSAALTEALTTIDEADDFTAATAGGQAAGPASIAAGHRSGAAKTLPPRATPSQAVRYYAQFAAGRLAAALGPSREASYALFGLGKVHAVLADDPSSAVRNARAKAEVYFAAALRADAGNWQAANELGVLLARQGRLAEAATCLRQSVAIQPCGESLHNLAVTLHCAGQEPQARGAHQRALAMGYGPTASRRPDVQWVSPDALTGAPRGTPATRGAAAPGNSAGSSVQAKSIANNSAETAAPKVTAPKTADQRAARPWPEPRSDSESRLGETRPREATGRAVKEPAEWKAAPIPGEEDEGGEAGETDDSAVSPADHPAAAPAAARRGLFWWLPWN